MEERPQIAKDPLIAGGALFSPSDGVHREMRPRMGEHQVKQLEAQDIVAAVGEVGISEVKGPKQDEGEHPDQAGPVSDQVEKGDHEARVIYRLEKPGRTAQMEQGEDSPCLGGFQEGIVRQKPVGSP